jgi:hypothetical protein
MTTSTQPAISFQKRLKAVDENGYPTKEFAQFLELLAYHVGKLDEAARVYNDAPLDPGTATTTQIATALNTFMASATET